MRGFVILALATSACSGGLEAEWFGVLSCGTVNFDFNMELTKDAGKDYVGSGTQEREYTAVSGDTTYEQIEFDAAISANKAGGPQNLDVELTCTFEQKVVTSLGGGEPEVLSEGCAPLRYQDYQMAWDGKDALDVEGADACVGTLSRL